MSATGRVATVSPAGEVDIASAPAVREALVEACASTARLVVLDLRDITFADSTALAVMIAAHKRLEASGCRLLTVNVPPMLAKALQVTGLLRSLTSGPPPGRYRSCGTGSVADDDGTTPAAEPSSTTCSPAPR